MKRGHPARVDYEYERNGTANIFMLFAPLEGGGRSRLPIATLPSITRLFSATRQTATSLVPARSFSYRTISAPIPRRYCTPPSHRPRDGASRNGSSGTTCRSTAVGLIWRSLNGVLSSQCLDRRIPDKDTLIHEIAAWQNRWNKHNTTANWQFTKKEARNKLEHLYPSL